MKILNKAEFAELNVKLHNHFINNRPISLGNGVSFVGNTVDALGKEDAEAYQQYLINEAYQQHGILPVGCKLLTIAVKA